VTRLLLLKQEQETISEYVFLPMFLTVFVALTIQMILNEYTTDQKYTGTGHIIFTITPFCDAFTKESMMSSLST
jgi:hypothetical protein